MSKPKRKQKKKGAGLGKKLGAAGLITLGILGAAGNIGSDKAIEGVLGALPLLGVGTGLIVSDAKEKKKGGKIKARKKRKRKIKRKK